MKGPRFLSSQGGPGALPTGIGGSWHTWKQHMGTGQEEGRSHVRNKAQLMQINVGGKCIPKHDWLAGSGSGSAGNFCVGRNTPIVYQRLHQTHTYAYAANLMWSSVILSRPSWWPQLDRWSLANSPNLFCLWGFFALHSPNHHHSLTHFHLRHFQSPNLYTIFFFVKVQCVWFLYIYIYIYLNILPFRYNKAHIQFPTLRTLIYTTSKRFGHTFHAFFFNNLDKFLHCSRYWRHQYVSKIYVTLKSIFKVFIYAVKCLEICLFWRI